MPRDAHTPEPPPHSGPCPAGQARQGGVTLIELLVTLSVIAILLAVAAPSFQAFSKENRAVSISNELVSALTLARSEAIKRNTSVTVCKTADPNAASPTCSTAATWQTGWLVFTDGGTTGSVDGTDTRLRVYQPTGGTVSISGGTNFANYLTYLSNGVSKGNGGLANGTLDINVDGIHRYLVINSTGRIHVCNPAQETCP